MKKRIIAMLLVVLLLGQMMPLNVLAEGWSRVVSNETRGAEYVKVTFQYPIYHVAADGAETISGYGTIVEQLVRKGESPVQPNIPDLTGRRFTGWTDEAGSPLDVKAPVQADVIFRAAYSKLEKRTVTIRYVFDADDSMALEPYVAEFTAGTDVKIDVASPALTGFVPEQERLTVNIPNIQKDAEYIVRYKGAPTYYTVRYHFQNVTDNKYTPDGFNRDAVNGHIIDDNLGAGETGWIAVGPYKIEMYPEGTAHAGEPVIAGGMTEVRDFAIEGFVQQEIVQRRVQPGGTTVVDVYYDRELHTYTIDNDGGTAVDSRTLRYGSSLGLPDPSEMERPGYEFVGFFSKNYKFQDGKWIEVSGEQKLDASCKMPPYDFTIEVRWQPVQQADYKVVYWGQSVKDAYNTPNEKKTYDFLDFQTFTGTVGQRPRVNNVRPQDNGLKGTFFELNAARSEIGNVTADRRGSHATATKTIAADGSTVINVYFDRQTVTFEFGHEEDKSWVFDYERVGLYGQNWRDAGYGEKGWPSGRWTDQGGLGEGNWTYLDGFNHEQLTSTSVRFTKSTSSGRKDIYQYIEALDSTPANRKWIEADHYEYGRNSFNLTSKFLPGFTLYGYNKTTPNDRITPEEDGKSISYDSRINVFSTRNSFTLTFANCAVGSVPEQRYKYEEKLHAPNAVPQRPDNIESDWEFKGWYLDAAGQVPVDWGTQTMPAANMMVYAKWAPPTYTVTYVDIRRNTVDTTQEVYTTSFNAEKFGTIMGPELDALNKQYRVGETKYVDADDLLTYTFMGWFIDENATVRWNPATPITADREVYAKWEPSGTVWYRYVFIGLDDGVTTELGKWPETPFEEKVWRSHPYDSYALASEDFAKAGMMDFPAFEGWRPMSTLMNTRKRLTEQYQEIPVYYTPIGTWPLTIHYVDEETGKSVLPDELHDLTEYAKVYSYKRVEGYKLISSSQIRATRDDIKAADGRVHITFTYKELRPLPYTVEYYQENLNGGYDLLPSETVTYTEKTSQWYLGETAKVQTADYKTFTGFTRDDAHPDAVTQVILQEELGKNVLKLYYDRNSYTVTYIYGNPKPANAPDAPAQKTYQYGQTVTVADKPATAGYVFNGWYAFTADTPDSGSFKMPAMNVVFQGNWAASTDTEYQVHFFFQNEDGTYPEVTPEQYRVTLGGTTGASVSVTEDHKADKRIGGMLYRFDANHAKNVLTGNIAADGTLVLKLYFERVMASYTVHHYLDGTTVQVAADETLSVQVGASVAGKLPTKFLDGFAEAKVSRAVPVNATITIAQDAAQNVITFYYKMPLTLDAEDASKTYDGTALVQPGFTVVNPQNLVNGDKVEMITLAMTADSSITMPGTEPNEIDRTTIRFAGQPVPAYYAITLQEGVLTVVQRLNVRKTITQPAVGLPGETGTALKIPAFSFTLSRDGQPVANARYMAGGQIAVTDGRGVFTLNTDETATFTSLEPGVYTVVEAYNGDWIPDGDELLTRRATLGTSGAGDVSVSFNNHRIVNEALTLTKTWVDGNGTAAQRPDTLALMLIGEANGEEVYRAPVTLTAQDGWMRRVSNLPMRANGALITYKLIETNVPEGYTASMDGLNVTNTVTAQNDLTITGTKTWVDGGRTHDNATELMLTLQRSIDGKTWVPYTPGQANFAWTGDTYAFTNLPSHDANGYAYEYRVAETVKVQNVPYTVAYTGTDGQGNDGIARFDENGSATVNLTNTIVDGNDRYVYGFKTWVDGGKAHDNATELTLTLERRSTKPGSGWEKDFTDEGDYRFGWTEDRPGQYGFDDLERYDAEGYAYEYRVVENFNDPHQAKLYKTTYSPASGVSTTNNRWVDITNTLIDLNDVTVTGTKTWVDGGKAHDNATELTLTLTRTSAKLNAKAEKVEVTPKWEGNTYTFTNLERYDAEGYAYSYSVAEAAVEGYTTEQSGYNFTNTITQEKRTIAGTKIWTDGAENHTQDQIALTLYRQSNGSAWTKVETDPVWQGWAYTFADLDRYDSNGYEYAYRVEESTVLSGYTVAYAPENGMAVFENNAATVNITNTPRTVNIQTWKQWYEYVDGKPVGNVYGLRPDDVTVTLTSKANPNHPDGETYTYTVSGPVWEKSGNTWLANGHDGLAVRTHDEFGEPITYVATESAVPYYALAEFSNLEIMPAVTPGDRIELFNKLKTTDVEVTKAWVDHGWETLRPDVTFELSNTAFAFVPQNRTLAEGETSVVFAFVPESDAYVVEETMGESPYSYETAIERSSDGHSFTVTNTLKLLGGDGRLTVTKVWDDKGGDPKERPNVRFQLLNGDGTPVQKDGQDWVEPLDTATNTAVFENVPLRTDGYIVKELIDTATNTYGYKADAQQIIVPADGTTAAFTNTRTIAVVTVTKQIVDATTDSAAGLAQRFTFDLDDAKSQPIGNNESTSFAVEIDKAFELTEYDAEGNPMPVGVWNTTGMGKYTATEAQLNIVVTNTRMLYDEDGNVTVTKAWRDGDGKLLADALIPEKLGVKLYEGVNATDKTAVLNRENGWTAAWSGLPAYAVNGTELIYSVKEIVDGADYGNGDTVKIGERVFAVNMNGFAITNTLRNSVPTKPEKTADAESAKGVQAGDMVTYTISRTSHLAEKTTATVTDKLPAGLDFVRTESVKVNGEKRNLKATIRGNTATWTIEAVPPMGTIEVVFTARVTEQAVQVIENKATVDLNDRSDSQFESDGAQIPVAQFTLSKSAKLPEGKTHATLGSQIDYTIILRNTGSVPLTAGMIHDAMLERAVDDSVQVNGEAAKIAEQTISLTDSVEPGKVAVISYRVIVTEDDILMGTVDNIAKAYAYYGADEKLPEQKAETRTPTEPKNGHLKTEKRMVSQPKDAKGYVLGETIRYEIKVTNDGNLTITDIKVTDSLSSAKDKVIGTIKSLVPGESETFTFEYKVTEADILKGKVVNEATATGESPDPEKPEVPVDPGKTETSTQDTPKTEDTFGFGTGYASVNVYDCCE